MLLMLSVTIFGYVLLVAIYCLYIHPISKFPGPKLAAITGFNGFYFDFIKDASYWYQLVKVPLSESVPTSFTSRTRIFTRKYMRQNCVIRTLSSLDLVIHKIPCSSQLTTNFMLHAALSYTISSRNSLFWG
ncbi:cytochrome P450 [Penicillium odoratum]|uniref:cytochrome P450 n=1 Tax=Penicillium odoratum TaxID=1167516 RepID=UPI00254971B7|nr:cytochrome P450 [Penicillium odoratum]KAJ5758371.1 cytochrome P450 [Penicillium odoratum]